MNNNRIYKIVAITVAPILLVIIAVYYISNQSILSFNIEGSNGGGITYVIKNENTGATYNSDNQPSESYDKKVPKGVYTVLITQGEKSYFQNIETKGFFKKTQIKAIIGDESERSFVGNNPGPCMFYGQEVLVSYPCDSTFKDLGVHEPTTQDTPTYVKTSQDASMGDQTVSGLISSVGGKNSVLLTTDQTASSSISTLYELGNDLSLRNPIALKNITPSDSLRLQTYDTGFIAFDDSQQSINYFKSPNDNPVKLPENKPKDEKQTPVNVSVYGKYISSSYSNKEVLEKNFDSISDDETEQKDVKVSGGSTTVFIYNLTQQSTASYDLKQSYGLVKLCSENKICALAGKQLDIYAINTGKPKLTNSISDVDDFIIQSKLLLITNRSGVVAIDPESMTGNLSYSLGGYTLCGIQPSSGTTYLLCTIDLNGNRRALIIDTSQKNSNSIDKKVINLSLNTDSISDVSAYKKTILISPNLGERIRDPATDTYIFDPSKQTQTAQKISEIVNSSGINRSEYTVINTRP